MYRITFLDEEQLYHTFCMEGLHVETHVCQLLRTSDMMTDALDMAKLRRWLSLDAQLYFEV